MTASLAVNLRQVRSSLLEVFGLDYMRTARAKGLHEGTIIVSGTLEELRKLLPPAKVEYVERQPTLEEIFLAIVGSDKKEQR